MENVLQRNLRTEPDSTFLECLEAHILKFFLLQDEMTIGVANKK